MSTIEAVPVRDEREQTRAMYPDDDGYVERDGARIFYEVYGDGDPTILFLPTWSFVHSRTWKMQLPYFGRHFRAVTFDGLGNGRSDRVKDGERYGAAAFAQDALAVMDATNTEKAVIVSLSRGAQWALELAANHPERVLAAAFVGPMFPYTPSILRTMSTPRLLPLMFKKPLMARSWLKFNAAHWRRDYRDFVEWWANKVSNTPHSTKGIDDAVDWALETDAETLIATVLGPVYRDRTELRTLAERISCPVLVVTGENDTVTPARDGRKLAAFSRGRFLAPKDGSHVPHARKPVEFNLALRELVEGKPLRRDPAVFNGDGRKRALMISSPIGLGHARRDVAIAQELRALVPGLEIDWLAQDPVTRVLEKEGERIHPASRHLANESHHIECESAEHDLHCFQAFRRMDEILCANFMTFHDVVRDERYDLWIGDEAWELDYYLHENPHEKRAPYAWLTDFVGFLPMPDGGERERFLTEDYNAQMVEHIAAHPTLRDRSLFVGNPDDIVDERLGKDLPMIRDWTERHFDFAGYVTGFDPTRFADRERLRAELGYRVDEQVCIVSVGGSGVGESLLRKVIAAYPAAKRLVPELRMIVVAGPRIDPASLPNEDGLEIVAYVHDLYRHFAACDLAVVQGGLTTSMELTANRRPFLYFPLKHHFEQNFHVHHRLERYGAGNRMDFDESTPDSIAAAVANEIGRDVSYAPVEADGARRAAEQLAEML